MQQLALPVRHEWLVRERGYGKIAMEPFEPGLALTVGNAYRRVLLSSIPGAAPTWAKIEGVLHEFSHLQGVNEDTLDIITNNQISHADEYKPLVIGQVLDFLARTQQIPANFAVRFQDKRRFGLPVGVISGKKIGEELSIFVDRIDRFAEKASLATQTPHRVAVGFAITADAKRFLAAHPWPLLL